MKRFFIHAEQKGECSEIICGTNALSALSELPARDTLVFTDENVFRLYRDALARYFPQCPVHAMPAGEQNKTQETLFALLGAMADAGMRRNGRIVCLGGGVVGDVGGLASALYMRGVECVQIPTTLLAQVDSSVGGKTAIDFYGVKNLVGAFKQPERVIADPVFFKTLPAREIRCGLGEIVKHGALCGELFDKLRENKNRLTDLTFLAEIVSENIAFKARVVEKDAREAGLRKCLNLGHTTGHALELFDGTLSHGEYVLVGILYEAELARRYTECDEAYLAQLKEIALCALGGMPDLPPAEDAARFALLDKKNTQAGTVTVTAPTARGEYALLEIPFGEYAAAIAQIREELC